MRWRIKDSGTVREYVKHAEAVFHLALNPSMKSVLTASGDESLACLDWHNPGKRSNHQSSTVSSLCIAVSPDGKQVAAGDRNGTVRIWETGAVESRVSSFLSPTRGTFPIIFFTQQILAFSSTFAFVTV